MVECRHGNPYQTFFSGKVVRCGESQKDNESFLGIGELRLFCVDLY